MPETAQLVSVGARVSPQPSDSGAVLIATAP